MCRGTFFVLQIFKRYIDKSKMEKTRIEEKQTDNRQSNSGISFSEVSYGVGNSMYDSRGIDWKVSSSNTGFPE